MKCSKKLDMFRMNGRIGLDWIDQKGNEGFSINRYIRHYFTVSREISFGYN